MLQRWPFNWKTPSGYVFAFLDESTVQVIGVLMFLPIIIFLIGSCWLIIVCIKDIGNDLTSLEFDKNIAELKKPFCNIVKHYSEAKELSENNNYTKSNAGQISNNQHILFQLGWLMTSTEFKNLCFVLFSCGY